MAMSIEQMRRNPEIMDRVMEYVSQFPFDGLVFITAFVILGKKGMRNFEFALHWLQFRYLDDSQSAQLSSLAGWLDVCCLECKWRHRFKTEATARDSVDSDHANSATAPDNSRGICFIFANPGFDVGSSIGARSC